MTSDQGSIYRLGAAKGLRAAGSAFDRVVGHLVATLTSLGVDDATIGEVGAALSPLRSDIVTA
jgi:hemoglobin